MGTKCYVSRDNVASDPNLTIEALQRTLQWVETIRGRLPPKLYLQVDNCWRENKNCYLLNWLISLVERGLFPDGIYLSFLPVGHTHNEVDQVASRISIALRNRDIHTPDELVRLLKNAFDDMDVRFISQVADTKEFLNPQQKDSWTKSRFKRIQNVSAYRFFKIYRNHLKHVACEHKVCEEQEKWSRPFYFIKA